LFLAFVKGKMRLIMKTRNRKPEQPKSKQESFIVGEGPLVDESQAVASAPAEGNGYKPGSKLQVSLKEDGSIDWDTMRESTKEKVKQMIRSSGIPGNGVQAEAQMFNPQMVSGMYDMLGAIEATVAQRFGKIPPHIAKQVFTYTSAEKQSLEGPTIRVLNKYIPDWMIKYQDEIALASTLIALTTAKVNAAITLAKISQAQSVEMPKKEEVDPNIVPN
jgi:hypothetical protein